MGNSVTSEYKDFVHTYRIAVACRNGIQFYMTSGLKSTENPILLKLALNNKGIYIYRERESQLSRPLETTAYHAQDGRKWIRSPS